MATKNDELGKILNRLKSFQSEYYTRGLASEVYNILISNSSNLIFDNKTSEKNFNQHMEELKKSESINEIEDYATMFANALMQLILIMNKTKWRY